MLAEWLRRPHVAEWWTDCQTLAEVRKQFLPTLTDDSTAAPYIAYLDSFRLVTSSLATLPSAPGMAGGRMSTIRGVRGIDQFLADVHSAGHGIGTQMVREFVQFLFEDPAVTRIQADPAPSNLRAIRCYEKAGFRRVGADQHAGWCGDVDGCGASSVTLRMDRRVASELGSVAF